VRRLARPGDRVLVLGGGRAGLLSLAAAREAGATGYLADVDAAACTRAIALGLCERAVAADLRDAAAAARHAAHAGIPPADLTVVVVDAPGCEAAAALLTRDDGRVLFFSMATSFTAAALLTEGLGSAAELVIGVGYAPDRGAYALDLVRRDQRLAAAMA
jgi:L-erythro-3,5-diaminohexanoate dehydrogenase